MLAIQNQWDEVKDTYPPFFCIEKKTYVIIDMSI